MFRNKRLEAIETVLDAVIEGLNKKKLLTRSEIQAQITEDADNVYVDRGGIIYKVDKDEEVEG